VGDQRQQGVHHQLRHRPHPAGHRHRGDRQTATGKKEISSILVPVPTEGFTVEPAYDKVGWHASDTHPLTFSDVRVPEGNLLGERGRGYANFLHILDEGRIAISALASGRRRAASTRR
jgi:alkylation response protein AidB-like acyl-CoA dehydrogenase